MAYKGKSAFEIKNIFDRIIGPSKKKQEILSKTIGASYPTGEGHRNWRKYKKIRTNIGDLYAGDYVKAVKKSKTPPIYEKDYVKWDSADYNTTSKTNTTPGRMILADFGPRDYTTQPKEINIKVGETTNDLTREIEMPVEKNKPKKVKEKKHKSKFKYRTGGVKQKAKYLRKGKFIN